MKNKSVLYLVASLAIAWLSGLFAYQFLQGDAFQTYIMWAQGNVVFYVGILVFLKMLSVIYPPLPSIILTWSAIPVLGWPSAYLIDYAGGFLGASVSYWLAQKYGLPILRKLLSEDAVQKIDRLKVKKGREIEGVIVLRVLLGTTIIEAVSYGAGLLKIPYRKFLIGFLISHPLLGIPTFLFASNIIAGENVFLTGILLVASLATLYLLRNRYFEQED